MKAKDIIREVINRRNDLGCEAMYSIKGENDEFRLFMGNYNLGYILSTDTQWAFQPEDDEFFSNNLTLIAEILTKLDKSGGY